nr:nuclear transport factor 2 family protein [Cyclobacteriaceae bacterium]
MKRSTASRNKTANLKVKKVKKKISPMPAKKKVPAKRKSSVAPKKSIALKSKLTKQIEAELLKAYYELWESNLSANMEKLSSYLVDDFSIFGSANGEVFFSKKDAVKFYTATADEMRGKAELRNRNISIQPLDANSVIVREECDLYVLTGNGWTFYGHVRISCIVKHIDGGWKAVHQHASFPDHRTEEGQQLATEKIEKENLELREAVKRRTVELESKNRELEIESSLERVRTVAMAMRKPEDMLKICESLYTELQKLGFSELRNSMINVYDDANTSFLNYDFSGEAGSSTTFFKNDSHPVIENFIKQVRKTRDAFAPVSLSGTKLRNFIRFRELNGEKTDIKLRKASAIHYYFYSIGNGSIGISTLKTIPEVQVQTLKRFRNVFEIAYQRYTDISLAEEQAREAQIELALERVRAGTMAMQKSEELVAVSEVLRKEMGALGVEELETSSIYIVNENETTECWYAIKDVRGKNKKLVTDHMTLRLDETWVGRQMKKFFYSKETRVSIVMKGENRKQWINYCAGKSSVLKGYYGLEIPERTYHLVKFSNGFMGAASPGEISQESWDLLQRATAVFSFAYKRFSDLQKAEAQTREAKIEAALERIRARALAMHRSDEFTEVAKVMREQMGYLGQPELETSAVHLYEEDANNIFSWRAFRLSSDLKSNITFGFFKIPKKSCAIAKIFVQKFKSKATDYTIEVSGTEQAEWYKILFKLAPEVHAAMKKSGTTKEKRFYHFSKFTGGALLMVTSKAPANDAIELQKRSAQVFDLAYRRFKDLQKAEAQTREAQIEAAVERVRAQSMAMHRTVDLRNVTQELLNQLNKLNVDGLTGTSIYLVDANDIVTVWDMSSPGSISDPDSYSFTYDAKKYPILGGWVEIWRESSRDYFVLDFPKESLEKAVGEMKEIFPEMAVLFQNAIDSGKLTHQWSPAARLSKGILAVDLTTPPTDDTKTIVTKMAGAFNQAYQRFLDLQKAEVQMRESEIQLGLERIRAKTMAMHKSNDLLSAVSLLFDQFRALQQGNRPECIDRCALALVNEAEKRFDLWITLEGGTESNQKYRIDFSEETHGKPLYKSFKEKATHLTNDLKGGRLTQWLDYLKSIGMQISTKLYERRRINTSMPRDMATYGFRPTAGRRRNEPKLLIAS